MPVRHGKDLKGEYYSWGNQKRYYFKTAIGAHRAFMKAEKQGKAIHANGGY